METNLSNTACFKAHNLKNKSCKNKKCRYWHDIKSSNNCIINKINENNNNNKDLTLQEIGDIFNITRMRVCQIEKQAIQKIKKSISAK
tara:strand:- start:150 stop:413 length:264 start_codon:yes stop_codon:yes gene_type:complete